MKKDDDYLDIIDLPAPVSSKHPPMPASERAAQFSPFAALSGYEAAIREAGRLTRDRITPGEDKKEEINRALCRLAACPQPAQFTYFVSDRRKKGGRYVTVTGTPAKIDPDGGIITLDGGAPVPIDRLWDIQLL